MIRQREHQIVKSARFALALADVIKFDLNAVFLKQARVVHNIIQLASPDPLQTPLIHPCIKLQHPKPYGEKYERYDYRDVYHYEI